MAKNTSNDVTGWVGWIAFASFMLMLVGFFHAFAGLVALFNNDVYVKVNDTLWVLTYTQWGWVHLIGGILAILAAGGIMQGKIWARTFAVILVLASAVVNMAFVPVYPIWSLMMVVVDVLVIYALIVHGSELKELE